MKKTEKLVDYVPGNPLDVTVGGGKYTVQQDANGRLTALRYGEPWRDCCGDGLIFALATEIVRIRSAWNTGISKWRENHDSIPTAFVELAGVMDSMANP